MPSFEHSPEIQIRTILPKDAVDVAGLCSQLGYEQNAEAIAEWIAHAKANPTEQIAFVACAKGTVVGWIEVSIARHLQSVPFALIGGLVVDASVRSQGVGRLMCAQVEGWARSNGISTIVVTSRQTREAAHRFYRRDGYQELKTSLVFTKNLAE